MKRYPILNIWIDGVTMQSALETTLGFLETGNRVHTVFAANPEKNFSVPRDPMLYQVFKEADLLLPDGIGMVLAARFLYGAPLERVPGCEFMQALCTKTAEYGHSVFLYGAKEAVNKSAVDRLQTDNPGLVIAGRSNGYVPEHGMDALVESINRSKAKILFLALGSPKQEQWIATYGHRLEHVKVCQGIGGTLDVITGQVERAPQFFCKTGLEWLYRLMKEPKRLKRQWVLPVFAFQVLLSRLRQHHKN